MGIVFDKLPTMKPLTEQKDVLLPKGRYTFLIKRADVMKSEKTQTSYLRVILECLDEKYKGSTVYDILTMSEKQLAQYKLLRFITAAGLSETLRNTTFELEDLVKVIPGLKIEADITTEEAKNNYPEKNIVDCFAGEIYYPIQVNTTESIKEKLNGLFDENNL